MIIDTHTHLDDNRFDNDLDEVIKRAKEFGVKKFIIPGADPKTLTKAIKISENYEDVYFAVGVHPYDAINYNRNFLEKYITHPKCVAVGECGLDYYRLPKNEEEKEENKKLQQRVFLDQIDLANSYNKPLIIHIREANKDSFDILNKYAKVKGVLHCFNASELLLNLSKKGFYFGIGGVLTFKNAKKLVEVLPKIPNDKLLLETDSPYLTPHPYRGKRNEPRYITLVLDKMAEIKKMPKDKLEEIIFQNSKRIFSLV